MSYFSLFKQSPLRMGKYFGCNSSKCTHLMLPKDGKNPKQKMTPTQNVGMSHESPRANHL